MITFLFSDLTRRILAQLIFTLVLFGLAKLVMPVYLSGIIFANMMLTILCLYRSRRYQAAGNLVFAYHQAMRAAAYLGVGFLLWIGS